MRSSLSRLNRRYLNLPFPIRALIALLMFCLIIVVTQPFQVFPYAFFSLWDKPPRDAQTLPAGVESFFIATEDGEQLEVWRLEGQHGIRTRRTAAVVFHGNAASVANFFPYQRWLAAIGITSYGFDYRGYGKSTGWPSEEGLYLDGKAVWSFAAEKESIAPEDILGVGISIGTGAAAHTALHFKARTLMLVAPYVSLKEAARAVPLFGLLAPFLWYSFPTAGYLRELSASCLILVHGQKDTVIPFSHSTRLSQIHPERTLFVQSSEAGHNDILFKAYPEMTRAVDSCLGRSAAAP